MRTFKCICILLLLALGLAACAPTAPVAPSAAPAAPAAPTAAPAAANPTTASTSASASGDTVTVGVPTLLTGQGASEGADIKAGVQLAVDQINAAGGILGKKLTIELADVKNTSAEDCALAAQVMDKANVVAYFPGAFYGPACVDEFGKRKPVLFHTSASKDLVDASVKGGYKNIFQTTASEATYGPNAYTVITQIIGQNYKFANKKVALLGGDITYDEYIQKAARKAFEDAGWQVVLDDTYQYGNTEFGSQLAKIRAEKPSVIMGQLTSTASSVAFMNQFLENPTDSLIYISWSPSSPEFIDLLGDKANGVMWETLADALPGPDRDNFYALFNSKYNRTPGTWPSLVWDDVNMWKKSVETCGAFDAWDCIDTYFVNLSQHPYKGLAGTYGMDPAAHEGLTGDTWLPMQFIQIQAKKNVTMFLGTKPVQGTSFIVPPWIKGQ